MCDAQSQFTTTTHNRHTSSPRCSSRSRSLRVSICLRSFIGRCLGCRFRLACVPGCRGLRPIPGRQQHHTHRYLRRRHSPNSHVILHFRCNAWCLLVQTPTRLPNSCARCKSSALCASRHGLARSACRPSVFTIPTVRARCKLMSHSFFRESRANALFRSPHVCLSRFSRRCYCATSRSVLARSGTPTPVSQHARRAALAWRLSGRCARCGRRCGCCIARRQFWAPFASAVAVV